MINNYTPSYSINNNQISNNLTKGLFIIIGESFRYGSQTTRITGIPQSYDEQINASKSHLYLCLYLERKYNLKPSIYFATYNTEYNNELLNIYSNYLIGHKIYKDGVIGLSQLFINSINNININDYDFIFYLRIDLYLKYKLFEVFNPFWKTIHFPCICWKQYSTLYGHNNIPRINDTMLFVPNKFFSYLNNISIDHDLWHHFLKLNIDSKDLDVIINTYHDSDSEKDYNPLYYIVNRPQTNVWHSLNEIFNKP